MIERSIQLEACIENLDKVNQMLEEIYEETGLPMKAQFQISMATEELFTNVCHYAYDPESGEIKIICRAKDGEIELIFKDWGKPFDPLAKEDPDITASAQERQIGGLGIFMVKKSMDQFDYRYENNSNNVKIVKRY